MQQILDALGKQHRKLRGGGNLIELTLKDDLDPSSTISTLRQLDKVVEWVEPNHVVERASIAAPNDPRFHAQWALDNRGQNGGAPGSDIGVRAGWRTTAGSRQTVIAVIDTGVDLAHPDLKRNLWTNPLEAKGSTGKDDDGNGYFDDLKGWNFVNDTNNVTDDNGHGTMMAGIIAAEGNNARGVSGVMQRAGLMPLKALDRKGEGTIAGVVEAMDFAIEHRASVINCSFGTTAYSRALLEAIHRAAAKGILVVAAAGNGAKDLGETPYYPASYQAANLISVAATTDGDLLASFSNWNSSRAQLAAPGVGVLTTMRGGGYVTITGTSASAALVSGVAGLLKTVRNWASVESVRHSLSRSARPVPALKDQVASGGVINAASALSAFKGNDKRGKGDSKKKTVAPPAKATTKAALQSEPNLDTLRNTLPQPPNGYVPSGTYPPAGYDDPKPATTANYASYLTQMTQSSNPSGPAGILPFQAADPTTAGSAVGSVTAFLDSKQFHFTAPVLSLKGRAGLDVLLGLSYGSKVWVKDPATNKMVFNADRGFPAPGWRFGFGAIQVKDSAGSAYLNTITGKNSLIFLEPNGVRRDLALNSSTGLYESYDSSYLKFNASTQILYFPNGTQIKFGAYSYSATNRDFQALPIQIKDRNGNYVDIFYKTLDSQKVVIDYFVDTAGRRVDFGYQNNRLIWIGQNRAGVWFYYARIDYLPVTIQTNFESPLTTDPFPINNTQVWLPSRITYPTGVNLRFAYNSYGQMTEIGKHVPAITGQGVERRIALTQFANQVLSSPIADCPNFLARSESAENWQNGAASVYYYIAGAAKVVDPSSRSFEVTINGLEHKLEMRPQNTSTGAETKADYTTYEQDAGLSYRSNPRVVERKSVVSQYDTPIHVRKTRFSYTQMNGLWLETAKDDYIGETTIYRRTTTDYTSYPSRYIFGLPVNVSVYAGAGTTLMSRTTNNYDETGTFQDSNNQTAQYFINAASDSVIQHDNANYGAGMSQRGNLTSVTQHSVVNGAINGSRIIQRTGYDTNGNMREETDGAGNRQQLSYADNYTNKPAGVGQTHVYRFTSANPHGFKTGSQYEYFSGNVVKTYDQRPGSGTEEQVVLLSHDFADRLLQNLRADGGWTQMRYWDNLRAEATARKHDTSGGADQVNFSFQLLDGTDRPWRKAKDHPDGIAGKYAGQRITFDNLGHRSVSTNFIAVNANWVPGWEDSAWQSTSVAHDQFDRTTLLTRPDGNTLKYDYTGCSCAGTQVMTFTDEVGCKVRTETDTFGRTAVVSELDSGPGNPVYDQVTYNYDVLDRIVSIVHAKAGGAQYQTRSFSYDGYGRLAVETHPESGTITYAYKPNDLVESVSNQNGKTATYSYNTRNLATQISYNDSGATPTATFAYDDYGSRSSMSDGEGQTTYAYTAHRQLQSETRTFSGIANKNFTLSYAWSMADQVKSVNYAIAQPGGIIKPDGDSQSRMTAPPRPRVSLPRTQAALTGYSISGTVRRAGTTQPMAGVTVTATREDDPGLSPPPVQTNSNGQYMIEGLEEELSFTVSASKSGYVFTPSQTTVVMNSNKVVDFTGALPAATMTANPNPIQVCDGTGQGVTTLTWNVTGAGVSSVQVRAGSPNGTLVASGGASGNVTTGKWVTNGTVFYLQNVTGGLPLTSEYTLAAATVMTTLQGCPPGSGTFNKNINYARNNTGALTGIGTNLIGSDPNANANVASAITYRAWNAYRGMNFGNGLRLTVTHNSQRQQMTSFVVDRQNGSEWLWRQYYEYYETGLNNGRIKRISDWPDFLIYKRYQYDAYNRLSQVTSSLGGPAQAAYSHDEWGNLRTISSAAGGGGTINYQTNATGAPTNRINTAGAFSFSYDAAGNMTAGNGTTFSYDAANRLKGVGGVSNQYGYDGDGNRVRQPGLYYVWSSVLDKVAMEVNASAAVQRAYVYANGKLIALQSTDGNFYWSHSDHLGSGRLLSSTAGSAVYRAEFDPFGQVVSEWTAAGNANLNTRKFTGFERDATGLDYANARSYTSNWGRFIQADPYGSGHRGAKPNPLGAASIKLPQSHNRYSYVMNDPLTLTDPSGLLRDPCCACPGHGDCEGRFPSDCPTGGGGGGGGGGDQQDDRNRRKQNATFSNCMLQCITRKKNLCDDSFNADLALCAGVAGAACILGCTKLTSPFAIAVCLAAVCVGGAFACYWKADSTWKACVATIEIDCAKECRDSTGYPGRSS